MAERTQGEWHAEDATVYAGSCPVARTDTTDIEHEAEDFANAEFIARAANAHDALVAAALGAVERCTFCSHEREWHGEEYCSFCETRDSLDRCLTFRADEGLRTALALAEEGDRAEA